MDVHYLEQLLGQFKAEAALTQWRPQFQVHCFDQVSSTNAKLWDLVNGGSPAGTVAIAARQTAGRGQWGRQWQSQLGGLYLSLALAPEIDANQVTLLTLASAWGIAQSLRAAGVPVRLKWPNDLVLAGRKLGGILTESRISAARLTWSVIGVGINWANPVPANGIGLKSFPMPLNADGIDSLERLAAAVLMGIVSGYYRCQHPDRAQFVADYEKLLINLGQMVQLPDEQSGHLGKVVGVSSRGNLRLRALVKSLGNSSAAALTERSSEIEYQPGAIALGYNT